MPPLTQGELTSLNQALLFLDSERTPVSEEAFKALGPVPLPIEARAYDVFILAARSGELPLVGNLCVTITNYRVRPPFNIDDGVIVELAIPSGGTLYELTRDANVSTENLSRGQIDFGASTVRLDDVPPDAPSLPLRLEDHQSARYHFDSVRVPVEDLKKASRKYCKHQMLSGSLDESVYKHTKFHPSLVITALMKVMRRGFSGGSLNSLIGLVQEQWGDDAPSDATMKDWFGPAFNDPELKDLFTTTGRNSKRTNA